MVFVEPPRTRRKGEIGKPRVEVGVAERAFSSQFAPSAYASQAVSVLTGAEHRRASHIHGLQTYRTGFPPD